MDSLLGLGDYILLQSRWPDPQTPLPLNIHNPLDLLLLVPSPANARS